MAGSPLKRQRMEQLRAEDPARAREKDREIEHRLTEALLETLTAYRDALAAARFTDAGKLAIPLGILADKQALRTGGATARTEAVSPEQTADRLREALSEAVPDADRRRTVALQILNGSAHPNGSSGANGLEPTGTT